MLTDTVLLAKKGLSHRQTSRVQSQRIVSRITTVCAFGVPMGYMPTRMASAGVSPIHKLTDSVQRDMHDVRIKRDVLHVV